MEQNFVLIAVIIGVVLDTLVGDPYWLPHPIRTFGHTIAFFVKRLNHGTSRKLKGALMWLVLVPGVWLIFAGLSHMLEPYHWWWSIFTGVFFFYALSNRCLIKEGLNVERILQKGDLDGARKQLSMIVGRDTTNLTPSKIRSAVVETLSENLSDGVVAPLFYFAIGGVPLMMTYKMINTLDSMVGYKNDKYREFGYCSAKMDDVANFIPARLTALLMILITFSSRALTFVFKYGRSHSSPNSGYPESALAGILNCRLGGSSDYFGKSVKKPYIGENSRELTHADVVKSCVVNGSVALLCYVMLILAYSLI